MVYKNVFPVFLNRNTCEFRVWAPKGEKMHILTGEGKEMHEMKREEYGYWSTIIDIKPGTRYKYQINEAESFPDPGSLSQPEGVHKASEAIDLKDFKWSDEKWDNIPLKKMIQYELHTGTFTDQAGFRGIVSKINYFKKLGINTIEIMPVAQFSGERNWGYDGVYPFAVHNTYGGAKELMNLVNECHKNNIAVILDVVYNHFGPEGNYVGNFGHYLSGKYSTPWGQSINFDGPYCDGVRNYVIQNALMWCRDFHIDGLRLDAVHAIFDFSAKHILQELAEKLNELSIKTGKTHYLTAESNLNDVRYISPSSKGGYGLHAQWSDDFHHSLHTLVTNEKKGYYMDFGQPDQLSKSIKDAFVYDGKYSRFRKKTYGNSTKENPAEQFVIFTQNHDQVGNRLFGERLISLTDFETAKVVAGLLFTAPNIPMLFMGEEYGEKNPFCYFVSHLDPELNRLVREGRKNEFKEFYDNYEEAEDPDAPGTFLDSKLSWNIENNPEKKAIFDYYRKLISLRKNHPVLKIPDKENLKITQEGKIFIVERWKNKDTILSICNLNDQGKSLTVPSGLRNYYNKILDSADPGWQGPGVSCPDEIIAGDKITVQQKSFVIYSNLIS